jgi:3-phosphoinositide dependent protein kinase-1
LICNDENAARNSFVGTPDYVSPEVLRGECATKACDLWAVGCMTYQMITGISPFREETEYLMFAAITSYIEGLLLLIFL